VFSMPFIHQRNIWNHCTAFQRGLMKHPPSASRCFYISFPLSLSYPTRSRERNAEKLWIWRANLLLPYLVCSIAFVCYVFSCFSFPFPPFSYSKNTKRAQLGDLFNNTIIQTWNWTLLGALNPIYYFKILSSTKAKIHENINIDLNLKNLNNFWIFNSIRISLLPNQIKCVAQIVTPDLTGLPSFHSSQSHTLLSQLIPS